MDPFVHGLQMPDEKIAFTALTNFCIGPKHISFATWVMANAYILLQGGWVGGWGEKRPKICLRSI